MRKIGMMALVTFLMMPLANCEDLLGDLLGVTTTSDFTAEDPTDDGSWTLLGGIKFTKSEVADELFGDAEGSVEIPGLGTVIDAAATGGVDAGGTLIMAKEVSYQDQKMWQVAVLVRLSGDKLVMSNPSTFPRASGTGSYGIWVSSSQLGYISGAIYDCGGEEGSSEPASPVKNADVISADSRFLAKTDSSGQYGFPVVVGSDSKPTSVMAETDCGTANDGVPANSSEGETNGKTNDPDTPATSTTSEEQTESDDGTVVTNDDPASASRTDNVDERSSADSITFDTTDAAEVANKMAFAVVYKSTPFVAAAVATGAVESTAEYKWETGTDLLEGGGNSGYVVISTGSDSSSSRGSGFGLIISGVDDANNAVESVTIKYSVASQEFPCYAQGSYNDVFMFGWANSTEPVWEGSVGGLQSDGNLVFATSETLANNGGGAGTDDFDFNTSYFPISASVDASTGSCVSTTGAKQFSGRTSAVQEATVAVPSALQGNNQLILIGAVADVGDTLFDTAVIVHEVTFN